ncbi:MAG: penicillin-binding protein 2, partial [Tannerella sp.]|nr:penicillin-binding protein 2 [Tannerella sp.]
MTKGNEKDGNIFLRYSIVTIALLLMAAAILYSAVKVSVIEKEKWLKEGERMKPIDRSIKPTRGNIYSDDDRIMATSTPIYHLEIDFKAEGFAVDTFKKSKTNGMDSLAVCLSRKFKDRTPEGYRAHLLEGLKTQKRDYPIYKRSNTKEKEFVSYADMQEVKTYPFLRLGSNKSGLHTTERFKRTKPFSMLASRTIGEIFGDDSKGDTKGVTTGRFGLEMKYDSLLRGVPGIGSVQRVGGRTVQMIDKEPVDGMDIRSTININIQDMVEKALTDKLKSLDAYAGTAIVMEVKTGEIKAITNMERISPGRYAESLNHAVADLLAPGSTFKVASMMVAIEDRVVEPQTPVDVGNGNYTYAGRHMTDHNNNRGGYGAITAEKAIWYSSNIGVAKIILKGYENNPKKFVDGLHRIGMDANLRIDLPGAATGRLRWPADRQWSQVSLPWMAFGYEVQIPPVQTLAFFNAIANDGKMVRPRLVKDILKNGRIVQHFDSEVIIPEICSSRTLKIIQNMLYNVVNYKDPTPAKRDGTGKPAKSEVITIAGKTGTAQIQQGGSVIGHNVAFCGYFPYEKPLYTCIVSITRPHSGPPSGGTMCGTVVKEIAEKIYSGCTVVDVA